MNALKKFWVKHTALAIGAICSLLLLCLFFWFQHDSSKILNLESRWLITSGVPLLAALMVGGYIKSFKGFGVELEASLDKPITNIELSATEAMEQIDGDEKRSIRYLNRLRGSQKRKISRLVLIQGRQDYYSQYALEQYLLELRGLKYLEIKNNEGKFVALLPVSALKYDRNINNDLLGEFICSLEQSQVLQRYSGLVITQTINEDTGIIESLKQMRKAGISHLIVVDENNKFLGVLLSRSLEKRIVDNVLTAKENA